MLFDFENTSLQVRFPIGFLSRIQIRYCYRLDGYREAGFLLRNFRLVWIFRLYRFQFFSKSRFRRRRRPKQQSFGVIAEWLKRPVATAVIQTGEELPEHPYDFSGAAYANFTDFVNEQPCRFVKSAPDTVHNARAFFIALHPFDTVWRWRTIGWVK